ncbi:MAG TPA: hypothetical protein DCO72_04185 [Ruminococcus sp.]|nr:hypothetical protein [Ruminococcus sp.]
MKFSEIISHFKEKSHFTQEEIAEKLGTTKPTISNWCTGKRTPDVKDTEIINKISELTGVTVQEIIFAIIEQNHISLAPSKITVNPFFKYFESDFNDISKFIYDESEVKIFLVLQSELLQKVSRLYGDAIDSSLEELLKIETVSQKMGYLKKATTWVYEYIRQGHHTFDPRKLNDKELFQFLDCLFDLTEVRNTLTDNLTENGYVAPFWNQIVFEYEGVEYVFSEKELLMIKNGNYEILNEKIRSYYYGNFGSVRSAIKEFTEKINLEQLDFIKKCVVFLTKNDDAEIEKYFQSYQKYQEGLAVYQSKMEEIRKLQYLYDKEKYPDLPEPVPPEKPAEKYFYKLSKKGKKLLELYELAHPQEETAPLDKALDYRHALEAYKGTAILIDAVYGSHEADNVILRDVYIHDDYICDHLHIYRGNQLFEGKTIGDRFFVKGTVYEYINSDGLKNLSLEITEISEEELFTS